MGGAASGRRSGCTPLPECEHPCLQFVPLDLPDAPFLLILGVAYAVLVHPLPLNYVQSAGSSNIAGGCAPAEAYVCLLGMLTSELCLLCMRLRPRDQSGRDASGKRQNTQRTAKCHTAQPSHDTVCMLCKCALRGMLLCRREVAAAELKRVFGRNSAHPLDALGSWRSQMRSEQEAHQEADAEERMGSTTAAAAAQQAEHLLPSDSSRYVVVDAAAAATGSAHAHRGAVSHCGERLHGC